ncbi:putative F-box domain-containing protein [Medicago truncatula]|uniref:Putative F-box domain-containing protein n=1 Tax=Medicago truncatula TaxID=3880 RepID=A0A396JLT4_MEDTR|nr:putative F-box domain-containing protein [Medicago truncatula]
MTPMNQNPNSAQSCKVISNLSEDLMFHIFTLVPINSLFNSTRYVCKSWAATIGSSLFFEVCEHRARSKLGLYVENCETYGSSYFLEFKDNVNGQFERYELGTPRKTEHLISTCDGILLLLSISGQIFVANPILKRGFRIPPFPIPQPRIIVRHQCTIARVPLTSKFKLFFLHVFAISASFWYVFYVLRIRIDNSWNEIARKKSSPSREFFSANTL